MTRAERFERFLSPEPLTGCVFFTGCTQSRGYGSFGIGGGKSMLAHRYAWELERGPIPGGLTIDHKCLVLTCCRVDHLQVVTQSVNASLAAERLTHCARGHLRTHETIELRPNGRRRCLPCSRIEHLLQWCDRTEAEADAEARERWPDLFAAAEARIAGIVNKRRLTTEAGR